jgi:CHAT domain-containing protein
LAERGELRESIRAASRALYVGQRQGNDDLVAVSKRDFAIAYSYAGDLDRAEQYAREALQHAAKDPAVVAGPAYKVLGDVAVRRGKRAEAIGYYNQGLAAASERFRPLIQISLVNVYVTDGRTKEGRAAIQEIPVPDNPSLKQSYRRSLGNLLLAEGNAAEAGKLFAVAAQEASGDDAAYERLWAQEGLARSLLAQGDRASARKAYLEAARSAETIRAKFRSEEFKTGLFGDVQQIFERALALSMEAGEVETAWELSEASRSRALLDVVRERVPVSAPAQGVALAAAPVKLAEVRGALREGEALVEFHSLDERLYVWVVRPGGIRGVAIDMPRAALERAVDEFRAAILERRRTADDLARRMYESLLKPLGLAEGERLVIVPHGALHYMPFQALRDDDRYLIERNPLAVVPSASVAVQLARRSSDVRGRLVAFGNPANEEKFALPGAEREIEKIGTLFDDKRVFVQRDASRQAFRQNAGSGRILHVAAHAEVDTVDPLASRILLARDAADPGFLEAREIYELKLGDVSLVTLSACESGLGRIARGDEILGFTRSFLTAGVEGMIVSLWPVSDDSTELLMTTLYGELAKGAQAIDAMRSAQIAVLKRSRFAHPFFWAPFNLIGDWRMRLPG